MHKIVRDLAFIVALAGVACRSKELARSTSSDGQPSEAPSSDAAPVGDQSTDGAPPPGIDSGSSVTVSPESVPAEYRWLLGEEGWTHFTGASECDVKVADTAKIQPPNHKWESTCGAACERALLHEGPLTASSYAFGSFAKETEAGLIVGLRPTITDRKGFFLNLGWIFNVNTDELLGLLATRGCTLVFGRTGPVFTLVPDNEDLPTTVGLAPFRQGGSLVFDVYKNPTPFGAVFDFERGWGLLHFSGAVEVSDESLRSLATIATGRTNTGVTSLGPLVVWSQWSLSTPAILQSWTRAQGLKTLVAKSWNVDSAAVSSKYLVWLATQGEGPGLPKKSAQLYSAPFTTDPSQVVEQPGPILPNTASGQNLSTSGEWAALEDNIGGDERRHILLIHLGDHRVFRLRPRTGYLFGLLGMSGRTLLAWEWPAEPGASLWFNALLRYDIQTMVRAMQPEPLPP